MEFPGNNYNYSRKKLQKFTKIEGILVRYGEICTSNRFNWF